MSQYIQTNDVAFLSAEQQAAHDAQGGSQHFTTHHDPRMPNFFAEQMDDEDFPPSSSAAANGFSIPNFLAQQDDEDLPFSSSGAANGFSMQQPADQSFGEFNLDVDSLFTDANEMNHQQDAELPQFPQYIDPRFLAGADSPIPSLEFHEDNDSLFFGSSEPEVPTEQQDIHGHEDVTMQDEQQVAPPAPATKAFEEFVQPARPLSQDPKEPLKLALPPKKSAKSAALPVTQTAQKPFNLALPQKQSAQVAPPVTQVPQKPSNLALPQKQSTQVAPPVFQTPAMPVQQNAAVEQAVAPAKKSRKRKQKTAEPDVNPETTVSMGHQILAAQLAAHDMQTRPPVAPPRPTSATPVEQHRAYLDAMAVEYDRRKSHFVRVMHLAAVVGSDGVADAEPAPKKRKKSAKNADTVEAPARRVPLLGYDPRCATPGQLSMILFLMSFAHRSPTTTPATHVQIQTIIDLVMSTDWLFLDPNANGATAAKKTKTGKQDSSASNTGNPVVSQTADSHQGLGNGQVHGNPSPSARIAGNSPKDAIDLTEDNDDTPAFTGTSHQMCSSAMHGNNQPKANSLGFVQTKSLTNGPCHDTTGLHYSTAQGNHQQQVNFPGNMPINSSTNGVQHGATHGPVRMQQTLFTAPAMMNMGTNFDPTAKLTVPDNFDPSSHFSAQAGHINVANPSAAQPAAIEDPYNFVFTDIEATAEDYAEADKMLDDYNKMMDAQEAAAAIKESANPTQVNGYPTPDASNAGSSPAFVHQPFHTAAQPSGNAEAKTTTVHDHDHNMAHTAHGAEAGMVAAHQFTEEELLGPHFPCKDSASCLLYGGYCFPELVSDLPMTSDAAHTGAH